MRSPSWLPSRDDHPRSSHCEPLTKILSSYKHQLSHCAIALDHWTIGPLDHGPLDHRWVLFVVDVELI